MSKIYVESDITINTDIAIWLYDNVSKKYRGIYGGIQGEGWKVISVPTNSVTYPFIRWEVTIDNIELATEFKLRFL